MAPRDWETLRRRVVAWSNLGPSAPKTVGQMELRTRSLPTVWAGDRTPLPSLHVLLSSSPEKAVTAESLNLKVHDSRCQVSCIGLCFSNTGWWRENSSCVLGSGDLTCLTPCQPQTSPLCPSETRMPLCEEGKGDPYSVSSQKPQGWTEGNIWWKNYKRAWCPSGAQSPQGLWTGSALPTRSPGQQLPLNLPLLSWPQFPLGSRVLLKSWGEQLCVAEEEARPSQGAPGVGQPASTRFQKTVSHTRCVKPQRLGNFYRSQKVQPNMVKPCSGVPLLLLFPLIQFNKVMHWWETPKTAEIHSLWLLMDQVGRTWGPWREPDTIAEGSLGDFGGRVGFWRHPTACGI